MKITTLFLLLPTLAIFSCGSDDDDNAPAENVAGINSYKFYYADHPMGTPQGIGQNNVTVYYVNERPVKVAGGFLNMDQASGFPYVFDTNHYTEVYYLDYRATIINKLNSTTSTVAENKQIIGFTFDGKMGNKIIFDDNSQSSDTIDYHYENNLLKAFFRYNRRLKEQSVVFYDARQNVDSIVTRYPSFDGDQWHFDPESSDRKVRSFTNYDDTANPFKPLMIFDETFHRSLSKNNYAKWEEKVYDYDGHIIGGSFMEWTFIRENGMINFAL